MSEYNKLKNAVVGDTINVFYRDRRREYHILELKVTKVTAKKVTLENDTTWYKEEGYPTNAYDREEYKLYTDSWNDICIENGWLY